MTRTSAIRQQAQEYQRTQVETGSPAQLVVLLYDGALRFLSLARERMSASDIEGRHTNLIKAQRIVAELLASLDQEKGGQMALNLRDVYAYMLRQLVEANLYDDVKRIESVIGLLRELRACWVEVERMQQQASARGSNPDARGTYGPVTIGG